MFQVAGASGKIQMDGDSDDEGVAVESYSTSIISALGSQRRNDVLAKLYMARADVQYPVRSAALHVWKTVVVNTPKTLGEILPSLMEHTIETLAHSGKPIGRKARSCMHMPQIYPEFTIHITFHLDSPMWLSIQKLPVFLSVVTKCYSS